MLATDTVVKIKGKVKVEDDVVSLNALGAEPPRHHSAPSGPVVISLPAARCTPQVVQQLRDVLASHPGLTEVRLRLQSAGENDSDEARRTLRVTPSQPLMADLEGALGAVVSRLVTESAPTPTRHTWRVVARLGGFAAASLGLGAAAGVVWWLLVKPPAYELSSNGGATTSERGLAEFIAADAWFASLVLSLAS